MIQKSIFLSSKHNTRELNGTKKSHIVFEFDDSLNYMPYENVFLSIENAIFPISFYQINETNNSFYFNSIEYTIEEGNYTVTSLINEIKSKVTNLNITFLSKTNKLQFDYTTSFTLSGKLLGILGFSNKEHTSNNNSLTSDHVIDLSGNNNLYISIDEISNQNLSSVDKIKSNVLINIPIDVNHSDILMYSNVNKIKTRVHLLNYKKFTVNILDENFNYVDFHDKDWYCTLLFESSIDNELYRKFIYLRTLLSRL